MGTWIEIKWKRWKTSLQNCRSLQWERGLKSDAQNWNPVYEPSFPAMGTWIEIVSYSRRAVFCLRRSLQWERGLKFYLESWFSGGFRVSLLFERVLKSRHLRFVYDCRIVVPCNGNVDWNFKPVYWTVSITVVPCNGNVDWNIPRLWAAILPMRCSHAGTWIEIKA